ncbi:hypothetical protein CC1G_10637 [Coprinopsis cinerea okayama7|uniref:Uncharacterized protein n=1 Tax=Coprinopsis cinerea (strain Okayama-7 / 130 / ATCC MYA-4618 / FGSC 9003) TaxID=240176 RepID=A8P634_COPC7|nr:hypothetical protein CC1G_10637 [Coprinopsis cinerea okayama7\|eukprot:XP_001839072.1 hypothetical protein CC1G_10637 [Coprinopsis cinerea okayama7\
MSGPQMCAQPHQGKKTITSQNMALQVRREVDDQLAVLLSQRHALDLRIYELKIRRSQLTAVSRLPDGVLRRVFRLLRRSAEERPPSTRDVYNDFRQDWHAKMKSWIVVTHVCRRWRLIALECASLWSTWSHFCGPSWLATAISRSKNVPITLEIDFAHFVDLHLSTFRTLYRDRRGTIVGADAKILELLEETFSQGYLLERITLRGEGQQLETLLSQMAMSHSLSRLAHVKIFESEIPFPRYGLPTGPIISSSFGEHAPHLQTLFLIGYVPDWKALQTFRGLTSLTIGTRSVRWGAPQLALSIGHIVDALTALSRLTELSLELSTAPRVTTVPAERNQYPASLGLLQKFVLSGDCVACARLLAHLRLPVALIFTMVVSKADSITMAALCAALTECWFLQPLSKQLSLSRYHTKFPFHHVVLGSPQMCCGDDKDGNDVSVFSFSFRSCDVPETPRFNLTASTALNRTDSISLICEVLTVAPLGKMTRLDVVERPGQGLPSTPTDPPPSLAPVWRLLAARRLPRLQLINLDQGQWQSEPWNILHQGHPRHEADSRHSANETRTRLYFPSLRTIVMIDHNFSSIPPSVISRRLLAIKKALEYRMKMGKRLWKLGIERCPGLFFLRDLEELGRFVDAIDLDGQPFVGSPLSDLD